MKFQLNFKTPDVIDQLDLKDREYALELISKWVEYGECVTIEFDTEVGTATVQKVYE